MWCYQQLRKWGVRIVLFAIMSSIGQALYAQPTTSANPSEIKPWVQVKTVNGEENTIRGFISPNCPFSKQYFGFFKNLQATLPPSEKFIFTPVVNKGDGIEYALAFFAVQKYYPQYLNNFVQASLEGAQDRFINTKSWGGIERIGKAAHIPESVVKLVDAHKQELQAAVVKGIKLLSDLKITITPSIAVAGTYIVTPEFTDGDMYQFGQLVYGIVSMTLLR